MDGGLFVFWCLKKREERKGTQRSHPPQMHGGQEMAAASSRGSNLCSFLRVALVRISSFLESNRSGCNKKQMQDPKHI